ncbi:MAG: hypothetical protein WBC61_00550 [Dehalococcoidia bacterium]
MNLSETEKRITEKQKQIETIQAQLTEKQAELESKKKTYSEGLIKGSDRSRQLPSLDLQKRAVIECGAESEALKGASDILQGELVELEKQKDFAELSASQGERYRNAMATCESTSIELKKLLSNLETDLRAFNGHVNKLISAGQSATSSFSIIRDLPPNISLERFLKGEVVELDDPDDREAAINHLKAELLALSEFAEAAEKIQELLQPFGFSVQDLVGWRHFVAKLCERTWRHTFTPKSKKIIPVDAVTACAHNELAKMRAEEELKKAELMKKKRQRLAAV